MTPEERHLARMQQNGYENPTYKFFEQMQNWKTWSMLFFPGQFQLQHSHQSKGTVGSGPVQTSSTPSVTHRAKSRSEVEGLELKSQLTQYVYTHSRAEVSLLDTLNFKLWSMTDNSIVP